MKAVICTQYGSPDVLELAELDKPTPKDNEICIKIHASAVTASDVRVRALRFPFFIRTMIRLVMGMTKPRNPVLGLVLAGEVESVGAAVTKFKPGDQVCGMTGPELGCYAEYRCLSEKACLVKKAENVSYTDAAVAVYGGLLAGHCLKKANIQEGQNILVYGASGAIGTAAVQLAKHFGATVTGVCSGANMGLVKSLGADDVIDYTADDTVPEGAQYDLIFDAVGKDKSSALKVQSKTALKETGKYISVDDGMLKSEIDVLELINRLLADKKYTPVIDRVYTLDQIVEAHHYVDQGHKKGNVLLAVQN